MSIRSEIEKFVESFIPSAKRIEEAPWIDELERKVGLPLSRSYKQLLTSFKFDEFETDEAEFFANEDSSNYYNINVKIFNDEVMYSTLKKAGLFHIGFPYEGDYDPICFDTNKKTNSGDFPIVKVDHESILCRDKVLIVETIAPSFYEYAKFKNS